MSQEVGNQLNTGYECEACGAKIISSLDSEKVACPSCGHVNKCTPKLVAAVRPATPEVPRKKFVEHSTGEGHTIVHSPDETCKVCAPAAPDAAAPQTMNVMSGDMEPIASPFQPPDAAARLAEPINQVSRLLGKYLNTMVADLRIEGKGQYLRDLFSQYEREAALIREAQQERRPRCFMHGEYTGERCPICKAQESSKEVMPSESAQVGAALCDECGKPFSAYIHDIKAENTLVGTHEFRQSRAEPQEKTSAGAGPHSYADCAILDCAACLDYERRHLALRQPTSAGKLTAFRFAETTPRWWTVAVYQGRKAPHCDWMCEFAEAFHAAASAGTEGKIAQLETSERRLLREMGKLFGVIGATGEFDDTDDAIRIIEELRAGVFWAAEIAKESLTKRAEAAEAEVRELREVARCFELMYGHIPITTLKSWFEDWSQLIKAHRMAESVLGKGRG